MAVLAQEVASALGADYQLEDMAGYWEDALALERDSRGVVAQGPDLARKSADLHDRSTKPRPLHHSR